MTGPEIPIGRTKILVPERRGELLTRQRLLNILYKLIDRKLVVVSAPAGYGKTSLLIDFAHHCELPCCWLALDPLDAELQRFIAYFIAAIKQRFPQFGNQSISMLTGMVSLEGGMEPLLITLVNEIFDNIPEHFIIVLDDFHLVEPSEPIISFVKRFTELAGENCHLIVSARSRPRLSDLTLLLARRQAGFVDFSDLAFTTEEIQALLAQNQHLHLSEHDAHKLIEETEGWITGLQLIDLDSGQQGRPKHTPLSVADANVFDYLAIQVLESQTESLQLFLLRSSLLEEFDANLSEAVLSRFYSVPQNWSMLIRSIIEKNLFALPVGADSQWVRYHHLFRDYLQSRLRAERPDEVRPILQGLAQRQENEAEWEKAYLLYKEIGDMNALGDLIERAGTPMVQHALLTLESWLKDLPPSLTQRRPGLLSLRGAVESTKGNLREGVGLFNRSISRFRKKSDTGGLALALVRRGVAHRLLGNYKRAIRDAEEAMRLTKTSDELQWNFAEALRVKGLSLFRQGRTIQASSYLKKALDIYVNVEDSHSIPVLLMETGMVKAVMGKYHETKILYENALAIWRQRGDLSWQATLLNNLGSLQQQHGEYEEAVHVFVEGLLCAERSGNKRMEALISLSLGDLYCEVEDFEIAEQHYQRAGALIQPLDELFLIKYLALAEVNMALLRRQPGRANRLLKRLSPTIRKTYSAYEYGLYQLVCGRSFLQSGKFDKARANFLAAKRCFTQDGREMEGVWGNIWLAAAYCQNGQNSAAQKALTLVLNKQGPIDHFTLVAIHQAQQWLDGLEVDSKFRSTLHNSLEKAAYLNKELPVARRQLRLVSRPVELPKPRLVINAFGPAQVWVNGRLTSRSDWQTQSVRDFFFYLLMVHRPMTKEQIEDVLWPNTLEPAKLRLRFKNEVYRLRRAIGQEAILYTDNRYQFNPSIDREYDIDNFQAYIARANSAATYQDKIELYQRAVDLVRGPYLEDFDQAWVWPERERLSQIYLSSCLSLAQLYLRDTQVERALSICQRAIDYDKTFEASYRLIMQIYHRNGDISAIVHTFRTLEQLMREEFDLMPSVETQNLYRNLIL